MSNGLKEPNGVVKLNITQYDVTKCLAVSNKLQKSKDFQESLLKTGAVRIDESNKRHEEQKTKWARKKVRGRTIKINVTQIRSELSTNNNNSNNYGNNELWSLWA